MGPKRRMNALLDRFDRKTFTYSATRTFVNLRSRAKSAGFTPLSVMTRSQFSTGHSRYNRFQRHFAAVNHQNSLFACLQNRPRHFRVVVHHAFVKGKSRRAKKNLVSLQIPQ